MKKLLSVILMVVILVGVSVAGSIAGVKKIRPDELKPVSSNQLYSMYPTFVQSRASEGIYFYAVVKLPVGKTVKNITYYHKGSSGAVTSVELSRQLMGESVSDYLAVADSQYSEPNLIPVENPFPISFAKIKKGYTYFLTVYLANSSSRIDGIEITYK